MLKARWLCVCLGTTLTFAQTLIDLRTQTKTVDFSGANATKPFKSGTLLPSICQVGEMFYKTDAAAGANLYGCTALNSWTPQSGTSLPGVFQNVGKLLSTDGTNYIWSAPGGDLSGTLNSVTVTQLQGHAVANTLPSSGQILGWNASSSRWEPQTPPSNGGDKDGVTAAGELSDFAVAKRDNTTLAIGASCTTSEPCSARIGSITYRFTSGGEVTLSDGTGLAYVYISGSGLLTVGHNLSLTCTSGCADQSGVTSFPPDSIPLWTWSATNGTWNPAGTDQRAFLSAKNVIAGLGIKTIDQSGQTVVAIDPTVVSMQVTTPATASASCTAGHWATDQSFYYLCVLNNTWKRAALSSW